MAILAVEHVRPMRGGAQSHLLRAADGHYYVVKFHNNPQHARVLANEWLGARLARALGLPVPEPALIDVPPQLIDGSPGLILRIAGALVPCASGLQFGSRFPTADPHAPIYDYLPEPGLDLVANLGDFIGMLVFDKWTCNCNGRQVVFCRAGARRAAPARDLRLPSGGEHKRDARQSRAGARAHEPLRVYMIDQGFCFNAGEWNFPDSPLRGVFSRNRVYAGVTGWEAFEPWLRLVESLDPARIFAAGEEIPPAWCQPAWDDLQPLLERLVRRRERVRELLWQVKTSARAPFENWTSPEGAQAAGA